jgi:membrane protein YqaA with SNARE-associated domain
MFLLRVVVASIIGAIIGWIIGVTLNKVTFWYDNRRLERMMKRTDESIENAFAPILEMDQRQW